MKKRQLEKLEKEVLKRLDTLQEFLDGPMVSLHEYIPSDPEYVKRVYRLHRLVSDLYSATFDLQFAIEGTPF